MKARELFRARKNQKIEDGDAAKTPLASGGSAEHKAQDKLLTVQLSEKISLLQNVLYAQQSQKLLVILQGMDTSGKDRTTGGVFGLINPMGIRAAAFKAPTHLELAHDFLWRVHREVPATGEIVVFNRSHYEDVLITRVHKTINDKECERRLAHICDFERMLNETGTTIIKLFLHISRDQQKLRLQERLNDPQKQWKFDPQDLVERKSWDEYQHAYEAAIHATDASHAPWYVIPADSKTHRNLAVASIVLETMEDMKLDYPAPQPELSKLKIS
jgi:PPK2 family polyphosphate:nucleotide phosphotransferase